MAQLDADRDCIVVRIVYDGTARSGKTTTLRALGKSLAREVETPAEAQGRTLFFDWLDYTGGRFDGRAIRCQLVGVPGQTALAARRRRLMADADAMVFVADTSLAGYEASLAALRKTFAEIAGCNPSVGLVVQANQRDRVDAVPIERVRADCAALGNTLAVTESIAVNGLGVRETFVFAVRLALDRVRELQLDGSLPLGPPGIDDAAGLLALLQAPEGSVPPSATSPAGAAARPDAKEPTARPNGSQQAPRGQQSAPWPPDRSVPSGLIWPPVAGRIVLHEACEHDLEPVRQADGSWANGSGTEWRLHSDLSCLYFDLDEGRSALIEWARSHANLAPFLSAKRCIVLSRAAPGAWRLWQLMMPLPSLESRMREAWLGGTPESIASVLLSVAKRSLDIEARIAATSLAEMATIENLGVENGITIYGGLVPTKIGRATPDPSTQDSAGEILRRRLAPTLREFIAPQEWDRNLRIVVEIRRQAQERSWSGIGEILCRLLPQV